MTKEKIDQVLHHPLFPYIMGLFGWLAFMGITSGAVARKVARLPQFRAKKALSRVVFPSWMTARAQKELSAISLKDNLLSPRLVPDVVKSLQKISWIRKIYRVRREFPARIYLKISLRRPLLWVTLKGQKYGVDRDGILVPADYYNLKLPFIQGLSPEGFSPQNRKKIRQAVCVAQNLKEFQKKHSLGLASIDVSNINGQKDPRQSEITLVCTSGTRIEWGRASILKQSIKVPLKEKLHNLHRLLTLDPGLKKIQLARLQFSMEGEFPVVYRPETTETTQSAGKRNASE